MYRLVNKYIIYIQDGQGSRKVGNFNMRQIGRNLVGN